MVFTVVDGQVVVANQKRALIDKNFVSAIHNLFRRNARARLSATTASKMSLEERLTKIRASPKLQSVQQVRPV